MEKEEEQGYATTDRTAVLRAPRKSVVQHTADYVLVAASTPQNGFDNLTQFEVKILSEQIKSIAKGLERVLSTKKKQQSKTAVVVFLRCSAGFIRNQYERHS